MAGTAEREAFAAIGAEIEVGLIESLSYALCYGDDARDVFLILTGYFDESGTHTGSPATVMAGVLGDVEQWSRFRREFAHLKMKFGFNVFHAKDFRARSGQFSGWSREKCAALCIDFAQITAGKFVDSVEFVLNNDEFENEYRRTRQNRKLVLDSKYGLCFRQCALYFSLIIARKFTDAPAGLPRVHFVLEEGHKNAGDALRIYEELKKECATLDFDIFESISFAGKDRAELMLPDFLAYMSLFMKRKEMAGELKRYQSSLPHPLGGWPQDGLDITHLEFKPNGLSDVRRSLEANLEKRREHWKGKR